MNFRDKLLVGFTAIAISIIVWYVAIVPELKAIPYDYELILEHEGEDRIIGSPESQLSEPFLTREEIKEKVVNASGDTLEILVTIVGKDTRSNKVIFDDKETYFVDRHTRKYVRDHEGYYDFPPNVQKQNYQMFYPTVLAPATFVFEKSEIKKGLEVYVFSCETKNNDISTAFPNFAPHKIIYDGKCKASVEPISGKIINFDLSWDDYFVDNKISEKQVEIGGKQTTDYSEEILAESANNIKKLYFLYDVTIPLLGIVLFGTIFSLFIIRELQLKELERAYEQLKEIDRLKDEFASMISHELRTPLIPIMGYCEMLMDPNLSTSIKESQLESIREIYKNSRRLLKMIEDILTVQKLEMKQMKFEKKDVSTSSLMKNITESYTHAMKEKMIGFTNTTSEDYIIKTDPDRLAQVFGNLIQNAIDFVPHNGIIEIGAKSENNSIVFHVKDNGFGIPKEKQKELFNKFYQADTSIKRKHGGTGLGLSICNGIVEGLGGNIWVESEEGNGSTFYFTVPKD